MKITDYIKKRLEKDKLTLIILIIYTGFALFSIVNFAFLNQIRNVFLSVFVLLLPPLFLAAEYLLKVTFSNVIILCLSVLCVGGALLGPCYDLYSIIPIFDDILHTMSGFLFGVIGYVFSKKFIKADKWVHVVVGVMFSLSIALLWEMIEFALTSLFGFDMQEDSIVYSIKSYYFFNSHNDLMVVDDIYQTIIKYGNGEEIIVNGYLDLGLLDTLVDMLVCLIGTIFYSIFIVFDKNDRVCYSKYLIE